MFRFLVWHVLLVVVSCELFGPELGYNVDYAPTYKEYKPRDYHFSYAVSDPHTGDHKSQWEVKENGVVRGGYSLLEPDGTTRVVEYIADDDGFRAVVKKLGAAIHPVQIAPAAVSPIEVAPAAIQPVETAATYSEPVQQAPIAQAIPEVSHYRTYDGQVTNYANLNIQQPLLYKIEQNLGGGGGVISGSSVSGRLEGGQLLQRPETHLVGGLEAGQLLQRPETHLLGGLGGGQILQRPETHLVDGLEGGQLLQRPETHLVGGLEGGQLLQRPETHLVGGLEGGQLLQRPEIGANLPETHLAGNGGGSEGVQVLQRPETGVKLEVSEIPLQIPSAQGTVQEIPGYIRKSESLLRQLQGSIGGNVGRVEAIPSIQGQHYGANLGRIENVPLLQEQIQGNLGASHLGRGGEVPTLQGQHIGQFQSNLGRVETVLSAQGQNLDNLRHNLGHIGARVEGIPSLLSSQGHLNGIQGNVEHNLRINAPNLGYVEAIPQGQHINLNNVHNSEGIGTYSGRIDALPQGQYNLGEIQANLGKIETVSIPQSQGDYGRGGSGQHINDNLGKIDTAVPGLVPIGPSYRTTIEYHGLNGNPEDDSRYSNDQYRGSSSQKVPNVLPVPVQGHTDVKRENKPSKNQFLIYYPESESH